MGQALELERREENSTGESERALDHKRSCRLQPPGILGKRRPAVGSGAFHVLVRHGSQATRSDGGSPPTIGHMQGPNPIALNGVNESTTSELESSGLCMVE